ncbi:MAG: helix-turn-helix domain-containing protein [Lachnospiraceae bacterium]
MKKNMDVLSYNLSLNLKRIRNARNLSLDAVADQTGISKSMLGQIERGQSVPTIAVLGKLADGLRVDYRELLSTQGQDEYIIRKSTFVPSRDHRDNYKVYTYFPYEASRNFEVYQIQVLPQKAYETASHGENTVEYVMVNEGTLTLILPDKTHVLEAGDAIRFNTDRPHTYKNEDSEQSLMLTIVFTREGTAEAWHLMKEETK